MQQRVLSGIDKRQEPTKNTQNEDVLNGTAVDKVEDYKNQETKRINAIAAQATARLTRVNQPFLSKNLFLKVYDFFSFSR